MTGPCVRLPHWATLLLCYAAWGGLGILFGWHWIVVLLCCAKTGGERWAAACHLISYIIALLITGGGGAWVRGGTFGPSDYIQCYNAANQTIDMSRHCLSDQTTTYQCVYVMHFIGFGWLFSHW